jgi:hypothetical protein
MYQVDARRKDQVWDILDGGSTPQTSDKDDPVAAGTTAPPIGEHKGTYRAPGK